MAVKCGNRGIVLDAFCGTGGNSIQYAKTGNFVIGIDIDPIKIECAKHNAKIYGVESNIEFICGDFLKLYKFFKADVVNLSPPWGGPEYVQSEYFDIEKDVPVDGKLILKCAQQISENVIYILPKNIQTEQVYDLLKRNEKCEIEWNFYNDKLKCVTLWFGFEEYPRY
jgi:trimethylguanosine synthase